MRLVASDFTTLRPPERIYRAVNELRGSVLNGGFYGYFSMFGEHASAAEEGLKTLDAVKSLELVRAARELLTAGSSDRPIANSKASVARLDPAIDRRLDELDEQFYVDADGLWDKLQEFGVQQGFFPAPWPSEKG